jgi:hypothetical protein
MDGSPSGLLDLAEALEGEALGAFTSKRRTDACRQDAALLRRMVSNREAANHDRLNLLKAGLFDVIERWCRERGYRCSFGTRGLTIQRGDEPAIAAGLYDTLAWDGRAITVV